MDASTGIFDTSFLDLVVRWVILTALYLTLTYFFRDRVMPEGLAGFALPLFVILPVNVFAGAYLSSLAVVPSLVVPIYLGLILVTNFVLLEAFVFVLPGFAVSSQWALLFFTLGLSICSALVHYLPNVSDLVPPGVLQ